MNAAIAIETQTVASRPNTDGSACSSLGAAVLQRHRIGAGVRHRHALAVLGLAQILLDRRIGRRLVRISH
jgi:hypothetical protein